MNNKLFIFIILLLARTLPVAAQDYDVYDSYGINEGLPQSSVWHITQDKNGFMWFSTADGICRFDGYDFTVYRHDPADSNSLLNTTNCHFYIDSEKDLWIVSLKGICLYNYEKDNFTVIYRDGSKQPSYYHNNSFVGEYKGYLWASMPARGLLKVDKKRRSAEMLTPSGVSIHEGILRGAGLKGPFSYGVIKNGKIWISIYPNKCVVYDIDRDKLDQPPLPYIHTLSNFNDSEVIASTDRGLRLINKSNYKCRDISVDMEILSMQIFVEADSQLIITTSTGLVYLDARNWKVTRVVKSFAKDKKVTFSNVRCLYKDRSGNLWIGTDGDGVKKLRAPNKKFRFYSSFGINNLVKAIYASNKRLYVGYFKNDLDIFDRKQGFIENRSMMLDTFNYHHVYAMCPVDSDMLLLNKGDPNVVYTYSIGKHKLTSIYPAIHKIVPTAIVPSGEPSFLRKGNIVYLNAGSHIVALDVTHPDRIAASLFYSLQNELLTDVFIDHNGSFWIGTISGLYYLENGKSKKVLLPEMIRVKTLNEDVKGNIWVGSQEGIYIIGPDKKFARKYTEDNGLSNGFVYGILRDGDDMWFSHNKGLSVYNTTSGGFKHYSREDGLQSNEFNTGAYYKAEDGTLFFGGVNGVNAFKPADIKSNPNLPKVVITNIKLFDKDLNTDTSYWNLHRLKLSYKQNSLTFSFAGLEFTNPEQNQYAYFMEGLDKKWIYSGKTRFARYPALPPGTYYFKVKASNDDGIWQETPMVIEVIIVPPFWQTWWFRTLCGLLIIVLVVALVMRQQRRKLQRHLRAVELQQKIQLERERISRDLHDTVGTQLSLISNNIEWVQHPLKAISDDEKSEKLQLVNQMSRDIIATLRETIWALKKEQISLEEFSDKLKAFVQKQLAIYPEIDLDFSERLEEPAILGPSEALNLFRICQEAIANALKYSGGTHIAISVESGGGRYNVCIKDNGKGFDLLKVDPSIQNGIENMRYRAADIGGNLQIVTEPGSGTTINFFKISASAV